MGEGGDVVVCGCGLKNKETMKFSYRFGDLEVRSCNKSLVDIGEHTTAEVVKWQSESNCFTVAFWAKKELDFDLIFVGSRPFELEDAAEFMRVAAIGDKILNG